MSDSSDFNLDDIEYMPATARYLALTEADDPSWGEMFQIAREVYGVSRFAMATLLEVSLDMLDDIENDKIKCPTRLKQKIFTLGFPMMLVMLRREAKEKYGDEIFFGDCF